MNLCTNAYQAMESTGGILAVSLKEVAVDRDWQMPGEAIPPGRYAVIEISDTGCGMSQDVQSKIFEPYYTTKEAGRGTGLGLAVVHGIVRAHQGRIAVYSEPGMGSTFRVYLPAAHASEAVQAIASGRDAWAVGRGERIVLVDDEEPIRVMVRELLQEQGYRVEVYASAADALPAIVRDPGALDLLITDMSMPGMSGRELAIRVREVRPGLPVLLCTGFSAQISGAEAAALGIGYVEKPLQPGELLARISTCLGENGRRTASSADPDARLAQTDA